MNKYLETEGLNRRADKPYRDSVYREGNFSKSVGYEGEQKSYTYDAVENLLSATDALGHTTTYQYYLTGKLIKVIDAAGNKVEYDYDPCDRLIEIRQYGENQESNKHAAMPAGDSQLHHAKEQNKANQTCQITTYQRDKAGQIRSIRNALGEEETYQYDKEGRLVRKEERDGYVTSYSYTPLGEIEHIQYADGKEVKLQDNDLRQLIEVNDWLGQTKIKVDAMGRALEVEYPDQKKVGYTYGSQGERTSLIYPDGKEVQYRYDQHLRLSEVKADELQVKYAYDEIGRLTEKQFQNGLHSKYKYDSKGQLSELIHLDRVGELDRYEYGYDLLGNKNYIKKERRGLAEESGSYEYEYDSLNRLCKVKKDGVMQREYSYDPFHNRKSMRELAGTDGNVTPKEYIRTEYVYDIAGRLTNLVKVPEGTVYSEGIEGDQTNGMVPSAERYEYDKRGNLTHVYQNGKLVNQYYFGALNRLEGAMNHQTGIGATYQYNGLGNRISKTEGTPTEPVVPTEVLNNLSLNPTKQVDDVIDLTREYHNLLQRTEDDITTAFTWDKNVLSAVEGDKSYHYLQDELGSPILFLDHLGREREVYGYDEFGQKAFNFKSEDKHLRFNNPHRVLQPFGFTGYQQDSVANTMFAQAREYQPEVGRFVGEDIIKGNGAYPFTLNSYGYCWNRPMNLADRNGKLPEITIDDIRNIEIVNQSIEEKIKEIVKDQTGIELTDTEAKLIKEHPIQAIVVKQAQEEADKWTDKVFAQYYRVNPVNSKVEWRDGDAANAYRHAMWNAILVSKIGEKNAERWTSAHENWPKGLINTMQPDGFTIGQHTNMDLYNNQVGINITKDIPPLVLHNGLLSKLILQKLVAGEMIYLVDDGWMV